MAKKDAFNDRGDKNGLTRNSDAWAKSIPTPPHPVTGRKYNSVGDTRPESEVRPRPVGVPTQKPGDSRG
jgi:hypothetical protein